MNFWEGFTGPVIATLLVSLLAVAVSVWAIVRTRVPKPHWVLAGTTEESVSEVSTEGPPEYWRSRRILQWHAIVRQLGPGAAESVATQVRNADGEWSPLHEDQSLQIGRGGLIKVILCSGTKAPGTYRVRLVFRHLPNTRKERVFEGDIVLQ